MLRPCCDTLGVVGSSLKMVKFEPTTPNMSQHVATRWPNACNMLGPTMSRYVALARCDRLAGALPLLYFCCIHIFSAKLLLRSQTFINLQHIQELVILCELDVETLGTQVPFSCLFTDCTKQASAGDLIHRQQTIYWIVTQTNLISI